VDRHAGLLQRPAASPSPPGRTTAAAWFRPRIEGLLDAHIHAIPVNDTDLAGAANQVSDYYRGLDGLEGHGPDTGPQVPRVTWEQYKRTL
jgi:hypothetical protein